MLITNIEHLELACQTDKIQGGISPFPVEPKSLYGVSSSAFAFNTLSIGQFGSFATGLPEILTTAVPGNYSVGFKFQYASVALGIPK